MFPFIPLGDRFLLDSWRVLVTAGILGGSFVSWIVLQAEIGRLRALLLAALMAAGALFGAHLAHGLLLPGLSSPEPYRILRFWRDGYSLIGAFVFCPILLFVLSRIVPGIHFWQAADAFSLGTPVGLFFARIGCYMKGCCWGTPIQEGHPFYGLSVKLIRNSLVTLHPVQLYSAAAALAIFCLLLAVRRVQRTPGLLSALFVLLYACARFLLEFYRGDARPLCPGLTIHQGICILLFAVGICLVFPLLRKSRRTA